jgi:MoaA/NifB/PqqE/SkfB family radical SAM enzyme
MPDSSVIPCCISPYDNIYGSGKNQNLDEIWNSDKFNELRLRMLSGEKNEGCARCYELESSGFRSMRLEMNEYFLKYLPLVNLTKEDGRLDEKKLKYIDIRFSNLCNFKCRGCGPALSSSWYEDHQTLHQYKSNSKKFQSIEINSPQFWKELQVHIPNADVIYFGGGEPLITKEHYDILTLLNNNSLYNIELRYNTNLSTLNYLNYDLTTLWSKFKKISISISIDEIENRAEYFRHGTNWRKIEENIYRLINHHQHIEIFINCTVSIMNVLRIPTIFEYVTSKKFIKSNHFRINLLLDPIELRCDVLPAEIKKLAIIRLKKFIFKYSNSELDLNFLLNEIKSIILFLENEDRSNLVAQFKKHTQTLDQIRNENFIENFPELAALFSN